MNRGVQSLICIKDVIIIFKTSFHYTAAVITLIFFFFKENVDSFFFFFGLGVYSLKNSEVMWIYFIGT